MFLLPTTTGRPLSYVFILSVSYLGLSCAPSPSIVTHTHTLCAKSEKLDKSYLIHCEPVFRFALVSAFWHRAI